MIPGAMDRRKTRNREWAILGVVILGLMSCSPRPEGVGGGMGKGQERERVKVETEVVQARKLERTIAATGTLRAVDRTPVAVKVPGRLVEMAVDLGTEVREGQLLARVESTDYELRLQQVEAALGQARARVGLDPEGDDDAVDVEASTRVREARAVLDEAEANRDRIRALSNQGILSTAELERAQSEYKVAASRFDEALEEARIRMAQLKQRRAEYEMARQQLADTRLVSPFAGAVQERRANLGEYLSEGAAVVVVVRMDPLRLQMEVAERDSVRVRVGQEVRLRVEGEDTVHVGRVLRMSPAILEGSRTLVVEADVPARGRLRPGSFARAEVVTQSEVPGWTVSREALVVFAGVEKVFVVEDGQAVERVVRTGDRGDGWVEVVEGLKEGDRVVLRPGRLQSGQPVEVSGHAGS